MSRNIKFFPYGVIIGFIILFIAAHANAQQLLFSEISQMDKRQTTIRNRLVNVNFDLLQQKDTAEGVSDTIKLNLFDNAIYTATKEAMESGWGNISTWKGKIEGDEMGNTTLSFGADGSMFGMIRTKTGDFKIERVKGSQYRISEIDRTSFPGELPPVIIEE